MSSGDRLHDGNSDGRGRFSLGDPDFESYLRVLKRHGCNLLVTGDAGEDVFAAMTRRLLGTPSEQRVRLLGLTDATRDDAASLLPDGVEPERSDVRVLAHDGTTRFTQADTSSPASTPTRSELVAFQDDVCDAIEGFEAEGDLEPCDLRLGVVSLCPLVDTYDREAIVEFVRTVGSSVLRCRGMAHYQLPAADDAPIVEALGSEFDARIEVRKESGRPATHRWHVPEYDLTTPWVEI